MGKSGVVQFRAFWGYLEPPLSLASTWRHPVSLVFGVCNSLILLLVKIGLTGSNPVAPTIVTFLIIGLTFFLLVLQTSLIAQNSPLSDRPKWNHLVVVVEPDTVIVGSMSFSNFLEHYPVERSGRPRLAPESFFLVRHSRSFRCLQYHPCGRDGVCRFKLVGA